MKVPFLPFLLVLASFPFHLNPCSAQAPKVAALFPAGGRAGQTIDVSVRGGGLVGAKRVLVSGAPGVRVALDSGGASVDESARPIFQKSCVNCHEARSPANRTLSPEQWASTVDRMINARGAEITKNDRDKIVGYLQSMARAGQVSVKVTIAADAPPGFRELRFVTAQGVSSAAIFEVGHLPEISVSGGNDRVESAIPLSFPVVVNGAITTAGERDFFTFDAQKGERLIFNLKAFRLNDSVQSFFNPALFLYDARGKEVGKSLGRFDLDPLIDFVAPVSGKYFLLARDLLWKGNPASVYRLQAGALPYDPVLLPMFARPGTQLSARLSGSFVPPDGQTVAVSVPELASGLLSIATPFGDAPLIVRDLPDGGGPVASVELSTSVSLPATFSGRIERENQVDRFRVRAPAGGGLELYARRLGSENAPRVTIKTLAGEAINARPVDTDGNDFRYPNAFPRAGEYVVELSGGSGFYAWEATGFVADFTLSATPDGINLSPGGIATIAVRVTRRDAISGPIAITAKGLPDGIRALPAILPPDDDEAVLVFEADTNARLDGAQIVIEGKAVASNGRQIVRAAKPIEVYRTPNNNLRNRPRQSGFVGVVPGDAPFSIAVVGPTALTLAPGGVVEVKVKVSRASGFRGDVQISPLCLPPGIAAQGNLTVPGNLDEAVFTLRATGDARFLTQRPDPKLPPMAFVFVGAAGGNQSDAPTISTRPITIAGPVARIDVR